MKFRAVLELEVDPNGTGLDKVGIHIKNSLIKGLAQGNKISAGCPAEIELKSLVVFAKLAKKKPRGYVVAKQQNLF